MASSHDEVELDREKFAYAVVNSYCPDEKDDLKASKAVLTRFLTAYYLADKFNHMEKHQFDAAEANGDSLTMKLLAEGLNNIRLS